MAQKPQKQILCGRIHVSQIRHKKDVSQRKKSKNTQNQQNGENAKNVKNIQTEIYNKYNMKDTLTIEIRENIEGEEG